MMATYPPDEQPALLAVQRGSRKEVGNGPIWPFVLTPIKKALKLSDKTLAMEAAVRPGPVVQQQNIAIEEFWLFGRTLLPMRVYFLCMLLRKLPAAIGEANLSFSNGYNLSFVHRRSVRAIKVVQQWLLE